MVIKLGLAFAMAMTQHSAHHQKNSYLAEVLSVSIFWLELNQV